MKRAIIIDDLEIARQTLKQDIADYCPDVEIVGEADGVVSGAKLVKESSPDIVFLDIQMNDGTGFDMLEILPEIDFNLFLHIFLIVAHCISCRNNRLNLTVSQKRK